MFVSGVDGALVACGPQCACGAISKHQAGGPGALADKKLLAIALLFQAAGMESFKVFFRGLDGSGKT